MATLTPEFRITLDSIKYGGASVGSQWVFDFDFKISDGNQTYDLKQSIPRNVSFMKDQNNINRTLVRANLVPETKKLSISGKVKASEEGSSEKYSESGSGTITPISVDYNGNDVTMILSAQDIKVKEYKGPKYDPSKAPVADLNFDFKVSITGISDNACDFNAFTDPEISAFRSLTNAAIDALQPGKQLAGATTTGNFALGCCIYQNDKMEYKVKITKADATILWGIHSDRFKDPSINANIIDCKTAKEAIATMEKALASGGVETSASGAWFPEIGIEIHELSHVEDYEKIFKSAFSKIKKDVEKVKVTVPANPTADQLKMMQDSIATEYAKNWETETINRIKSGTFLMDSEKSAQNAAVPALKRAIQRVKDFQKTLNCK